MLEIIIIKNTRSWSHIKSVNHTFEGNITLSMLCNSDKRAFSAIASITL